MIKMTVFPQSSWKKCTFLNFFFHFLTFDIMLSIPLLLIWSCLPLGIFVLLWFWKENRAFRHVTKYSFSHWVSYIHSLCLRKTELETRSLGEVTQAQKGKCTLLSFRCGLSFWMLIFLCFELNWVPAQVESKRGAIGRRDLRGRQ